MMIECQYQTIVMYEISRRGPLFYRYFEAASLCKLRCFFLKKKLHDTRVQNST